MELLLHTMAYLQPWNDQYRFDSMRGRATGVLLFKLKKSYMLSFTDSWQGNAVDAYHGSQEKKAWSRQKSMITLSVSL
jgi:hypothetical protein